MKIGHLVLLSLVAISTSAIAANQREELNALVVQLQINPADNALREKVIKQAQELKPAPAIPEQARAAFVEGNALAKSAKDASQQTLAVQSFQDALKIAPWWGDAYYNLAVAHELAGQFDAAQSSLKLYLLTNPGEAAAREAQDRSYAINAKKKLAVAQQNSPATIAEREQAFLLSLEGAEFVGPIEKMAETKNQRSGQDTFKVYRIGYFVRNRQLHRSSVAWWPSEGEPPFSTGSYEADPLTSRHMTIDRKARGLPAECSLSNIEISDDGKLLTSSGMCWGRNFMHLYTRR